MMAQTTNSEHNRVNQSTSETAGSPHGDGTFSDLFPLALYTNREDPGSAVQLTYDIAAAPKIGKDAEGESYDRMPIEDFGKSVLAKLGWQEGKAIGRTNMLGGVVTQPIEYIPRQHRLGLGAKPLTKEQLKKMDGQAFD